MAPPSILTDTQRQFWDEIVGSVSPDHFRPADLPILAAYCQQRAIHDKALAELEGSGLTAMGPGGNEIVSPHYSVVERAAKLMLSLARSLRLTPQSRVRPLAAGRATKGEQVKPWQSQAAARSG